MQFRVLRQWVLEGVALVFLGAIPALGVRANTVDVYAQLTGVKYATSSYTTVGIVFNGSDLHQVIAGPEMWHQTAGTTLLGDANGNYLTFCVEINQDVLLTNPPTTYGFYTGTVASAPTPGNPIPGASGMGTAKATLLEELWARHYGDVVDATSGAAFQVAVWDIVYDADFNLGSGNLKAYGNCAATALAATWLTDVNTNASPYTTPNLIGLKNDLYQDQVTFGPPVLSPPTETPLPTAASGAMVVLLGVGAGRVGRRRGR